MKETKLTCIVCPRGCNLTVKQDLDTIEVTGNKCIRGKKYGINEVTNPVRKITSTVKINNGIHSRLPVISDKEIPKDLLFEAMKVINEITVNSPVSVGDVLVQNILGTDANIIASRSM